MLATEGDPIALMAAPAELESGLLALARRAVAELGAKAIVIGGGPLGRSAIALRGKVGVPVIEPIPEAVLRVAEMLGLAGATHEALALVGMRRHPMSRDIEPARHPNAVVLNEWSSSRSSPTARAGCPISRMCSPTDIIFGVFAPSL